MDQNKSLWIFFSVLFLTLFFLFPYSSHAANKMAFIPSGTYFVGIDDPDEDTVLEGDLSGVLGINLSDSTPKTPFRTNGFYIDIFEVTNEQYRRFTKASGYPAPPHWNNQIPSEEGKFPATNMTWFDGKNYCDWSGKRLPTEEEWEIAARGGKRYLYPWGNRFDPKKANFNTGKVAAVGSYLQDKSTFGVYDMAGNVTEWTSSWYDSYPESSEPSSRYGTNFKVMRGGEGVSATHHFKTNKILLRLYVRNFSVPKARGLAAGFRCAKSVASKK